jgi:hypothetical protein
MSPGAVPDRAGRRRPRRALLGALATGLLIVAGGVARAERPADEGGREGRRAGVVEHDVVEVKPGKRPIKAVTIDNQLGDVRIEGHDGKGLVIFAYKRAPDEAALDQLRVSLVPDPDGPMRITTAIDRPAEKTTLPAGQVRIDLVVRAPRGARVNARVGRGELVLRNMDAGGELDAGAGTISVENVSGTIYARSVDGDQSFEEVFGDLDVQALAADLIFDTVRGRELVASVHHGTISARRVTSRQIDLRTTRGRIQLEGELALGGKLVVASRHGDVDVRVRSAGALKVRAVAGVGELKIAGAEMSGLDRERGEINARYGKGRRAAAVELRSRYGDVRFEVIE